MNASHARLLLIALVATVGGLHSRAHAQRMLTFSSVTAWGNSAAPATGLAATGTGADALLGGAALTTSGGGAGALVLNTSPFAIENLDGTPDQSRVFSTGFTRQTFLLDRDGDIVVPLLVDGRVTIGGHATPAINHSETNVTARIELWRETAVGSGAYASTTLFKQFQQIKVGPIDAPSATFFSIHATDVARFESQTGGDNRRYQIRFMFNIGVQVNLGGAGPLGAFASADFSSSPQYGIVSSLSAEPHAYTGNSRIAVNAPEARSHHGVSGLHSKVGVIEPGVVYSGHTALPSDRLTILNNGSAPTRPSEHTLAVASIIAGAGPDTTREGVAPHADVISASFDDYGTSLAAATAIQASAGAGNPLTINFSAFDTGFSVQSLDHFIQDNPRTTWVSASGNFALAGAPGGSSGTVPIPNFAYNILSVGALESGFNKPTDFSSTTGGVQPLAPQIMAPGEYVLSAASRDTDGNGITDDFTRSFLGDDWRYAGAATTNRIAGTSFAAPHVSGAVALMHEYADFNGFDEDAVDHRVMKAVLLAGASTSSITNRAGGAWAQVKSGMGVRTDPLYVFQSLDSTLGAGKLDIDQALNIFAGEEARDEDDNALAHRAIDMTGFPYGLTGTGGTRKAFWDRETVSAATGGTDATRSTVDYLLGGTAGLSEYFAAQGSLRACLTWDIPVDATGTLYGILPLLELRLYCDGPDAGNVDGFDPANPTADFLLAQTLSGTENVRLLDMILNPVDLAHESILNESPNFYLQVANLSGADAIFGLAVSVTPTSIPAPCAAAVLGLMSVFASRRRRA